MILTLRLLLPLPRRQTEGFVASIFSLAGIDLPIPDQPTMCRRNQTLNIEDPVLKRPSGPISLIVDSTGLKICGQGEWHSKKHGEKSRRRWKKLHIGVDDDGWIRTSCLTDGNVQDPTMVPELLAHCDCELERFVADGIYDHATVYRAIHSIQRALRSISWSLRGEMRFSRRTRLLRRLLRRAHRRDS